MKLVKQSYEILEQKIPKYSSNFKEEYINNMYKHIERCGRTCYKSERLITEGSAKRFVEGLIKTNHLSVLEHGVIYLQAQFLSQYHERMDYYDDNPYTKVDCPLENNPNDLVYITTNYRVIIENGWEDDLQYLCEPTEYHEKRRTVLLHGCIHTYKDLTRHRKASFSIESTRYCNYSKIDKFGEMKFVLLPWMQDIENDPDALEEGTYSYFPKNEYKGIMPYYDDWNELLFNDEAFYPDSTDFLYIKTLLETEATYNKLIELGWRPQQAAEILPQCTTADIVMTAFDSDWKFIFDLRSDTAATGEPHPLVEELMTPLRDEFKEKEWI